MKVKEVSLIGLALVFFGAAAEAVSLCSYRAPETLLLDADVSFSYQYFDDANTAEIDVSAGQIDFSFDRLRDTESFGFVARLDGRVGLKDFLPNTWLGEGAASFRYYVSRVTPLFGYGGLRGIAATGQTQLGLEIRSGFGFGRFYDVTPLAKAMTIHRNLRSSKAIRGLLSDAAVSQVAKAIGGLSAGGDVTNAVAAIETAIEAEAGVQLDARSLLMIEDVATGTEPQRFCGFSGQAGLGYELLDPYGGPPGFVVALSGDLAFAPDPSGQLEGHLSFSGPFDLADENTLVGSFSYEILIGNTSSVEASYMLQRIKPGGNPAATTHEISCNLLFEVAAVDVMLRLTLARTTGDAGWSIEAGMAAALDLL